MEKMEKKKMEKKIENKMMKERPETLYWDILD